MNTYKKTIILKSTEPTQKAMAVLTLEKKNDNTFGDFKIYNTNQTDYVLGIKSNENIIKQNINLVNNKSIFKCSKAIDIDGDISCILFTTEKDKLEQMLYGTNSKDGRAKSAILSSMQSSINKINSIQVNEKTITVKDKPDTPKEQIQQKQDEVYEKISHEEQIATAQSHARLFENNEEEIEKTIDENMTPTEHKFYNMISEQLDELFEKYQHETNLEKLIESSKWVKINHEYDNKYYVVGIIYKDNDIKYICYGVPGNYNTEPPRELRGYSQWLPTDVADPYNKGYWVMYQDADTGENVYIE